MKVLPVFLFLASGVAGICQIPSAIRPVEKMQVKRIEEKLPDLSFRGLTVTYTEGKGLLVEYEVLNKGTAAADMNKIYLDGYIYRGYQEAPGGGTILKQGPSANMLGPGEIMAASMKITTRMDTTDKGSYSYRLVIDEGNSVKELSETNNSAAIRVIFATPPPPVKPPEMSVAKAQQQVTLKNGPGITNTIVKKPDLTVQIKTLQYLENGRVEAAFAVSNIGTEQISTRDVSVQAYIIDDAGKSIPAGGAMLNPISGNFLKPGETMSGSGGLSFIIALDKTKNYTYKLMVDNVRTVSELKEDNNEDTRQIVLSR